MKNILIITFLCLMLQLPKNAKCQINKDNIFAELDLIIDTASKENSARIFEKIYLKYNDSLNFDSTLIAYISNHSTPYDLFSNIGGYYLNSYFNYTKINDLDLVRKVLLKGIELEKNIMKNTSPKTDEYLIANGNCCVLQLLLGINLFLNNEKTEAKKIFTQAKKFKDWEFCLPAFEDYEKRVEIEAFIRS